MSKTIMVFAPHPDDEVLGVGGTIIKRAERKDKIIVCIATGYGMPIERKDESRKANNFMGVHETIFLDFLDLGLDRVPHKVFTEAISEVVQRYKPDEVYMPHGGDLHTDHKALTAAVMVAIRPKYNHIPIEAYTYETLSETGWDYQNPINYFCPNVYINITDTIKKKLEALAMHKSQIEEYPGCRSLRTIEQLSAYRGSQAGFCNAEAFSLVRRYTNE